MSTFHDGTFDVGIFAHLKLDACHMHEKCYEILYLEIRCPYLYVPIRDGVSRLREIWTETSGRRKCRFLSLRGPDAGISKTHRLQIQHMHIILFCEGLYVQQIAFPHVLHVRHSIRIAQEPLHNRSVKHVCILLF